VALVLEDGELIRETFEIERFLGEGAFARVYRAYDRLLRRRVALKVFKRDFPNIDELAETLSEGRILNELEHRNIVRVFDAGIFERGGHKNGYFAMEYVAGGTLEAHWQSYGNRYMPVSEAVDLVRQVAEGLAGAHGRHPPIIHRDIKPQNILVGWDGQGLRARLGDFGLAKSVSPVTLLASAHGTIGFKPPEAFMGEDTTGSDVWALGATLYRLLTDRFPYPEMVHQGFGSGHNFVAELASPRAYNVLVDADLEDIVLKCLAIDRQDRFVDANVLRSRLAAWSPPEPEKASGSQDSTFAASKLTATRDVKAQARLEQQIRDAFRLAKTSGHLDTAADLLESAIAKSPDLRARHGSRLVQWRRGVWL